jgi:hypothetical protein
MEKLDSENLHRMIDANDTGKEFLHSIVDALKRLDDNIVKLVDDLTGDGDV